MLLIRVPIAKAKEIVFGRTKMMYEVQHRVELHNFYSSSYCIKVVSELSVNVMQDLETNGVS